MPIFLKVDGADGVTYSSSRHSNAVNVLFGDGSVKNVGRSIGGAGVTVLSGNLEVSRISLPNPTAGLDYVDSGEVRAVARTMEVILRKSSGRMDISIPRTASDAARRAQHTNNLKQLGLACHRRIPLLELFVYDIGNPHGIIIRLENVLISRLRNDPASTTPQGRITSVQVDPSDPASGSLNQYSLNFSKITYNY